ncbi:hypothetical protein TNCV_1762621 [Trichonephila clavipes]|nr:hypothetical protein TNCV_1762621 [Trichonephila clavipes]
MVDHGFEVPTQPKVAKILVRKIRMPSCWKKPVEDSSVAETAAEHLFYTMDVVWWSTILQKHCGCITSPCPKN